MATRTTPDTDSISELTIVDTDSHVTETADKLRPYIESRNPAVLRFLDGADPVSSQLYSSTDTTPSFNQIESEGELVHDASSPEKKHELMDEFAIDYTILTPGMNLGLASVNHDQTAVALGAAYNDWLLDTYLDLDPGFVGSLLVAPQKPDRAAEEIDRVADESGIVAIQLPASGLVPPAGHFMYEPIYEAAADHDLPILMHSGNSTTTASFPVQRTWAETFMEDHAFTFPAEAMWHLISLICRGIPEKYPHLQFIHQEAGVEWLPWMMWRLDDHYLQNSQDVPMLTDLPSEYITEQFFFTSQPLGHTDNHEQLSWVLKAAGGSQNIMFATDHPHPDFDPPKELLDPIQQYFDHDEISGIMGESAVDVFGL